MDCSSCHAPLSTEDVRAAGRAGRCVSCDAALELDAYFSESVPDGVTVDIDRPTVRGTSGSYRGAGPTRPGRFRARWRWWRLSYALLTVLAVAWNAVMVADLFRGTTLLAGALQLAIGLILFVWVLSGWLNWTTLEVRDGRLTRRHAPLAWNVGTHESLDDSAGFEVVSTSTRPEEVSHAWRLDARLKSGGRATIAQRLEHGTLARFLCTRLEHQLESWREPEVPRVRVGELKEEELEAIPRSRQREV